MRKARLIPSPLIPVIGLVSLLAATGCRGESQNGGTQPDAAEGVRHTIYEVQDPSMPVGTPVTLRGVVVTAVDTFGARTGGLYVQEPEGGPYSGVLVFLTGNQAARLQPGDLVDVLGGAKEEFTLETDECERTSDCTLTQIVAPAGGSVAVTKVGTGEIPEPVLLLPQDLAADDEEAEKWEGVLIRFENVRVHRRPRNVSMSDDTLKEMTVTGPFQVSSSLTELSSDIGQGQCYAEVVGIGDYFFTYKVLPRSAADLVLADADTCLPLEEGDEACADGVDNDYNGFVDCEDFGCAEAKAACPTPSVTVVEVQDGAVPAGTVVRLEDVIVTARSFNHRTVWIQDDADPAPYNGVQLFNGNTAFAAGVVAGARITVVGRVVEFDGLNQGGTTVTQLVDLTIESVEEDAVTPKVLGDHPLATLLTEPYDGVLVRLENMRITERDQNPQGFLKFVITDGTSSVRVDDSIFRFTGATVGQCLAAIGGVMHDNPFDNLRVLLPREGDVDASDGTCVDGD